MDMKNKELQRKKDLRNLLLRQAQELNDYARVNSETLVFDGSFKVTSTLTKLALEQSTSTTRKARELEKIPLLYKVKV
jgi:hypothetical protein